MCYDRDKGKRTRKERKCRCPQGHLGTDMIRKQLVFEHMVFRGVANRERSARVS